MTEKDYSHLSGKSILFVRGWQFIAATTTGCDRSVGISIVNSLDKENYLLCLNGPLSPNYVGSFSPEIVFKLKGLIGHGLCSKMYNIAYKNKELETRIKNQAVFDFISNFEEIQDRVQELEYSLDI